MILIISGQVNPLLSLIVTLSDLRQESRNIMRNANIAITNPPYNFTLFFENI